MILAYVQTPFVCNQVRIFSNALLDTAAGNWSFSYMWTDVSGIGRLYPNIKEITSKNLCPSQYWSCFCSQKKKNSKSLFTITLTRLCAMQSIALTHRFCESTDHNTIHLGHQSFFSQNTQWGGILFASWLFLLKTSRDWMRIFLRSWKLSQCNPDSNLIAVNIDLPQLQMMILRWHSFLLNNTCPFTLPSLIFTFPLIKAGSRVGTKTWILLSGYSNASWVSLPSDRRTWLGVKMVRALLVSVESG